MKKLKRNLIKAILLILSFVLSNDMFSQTQQVSKSKCVIGHFSVSVPKDWKAFSNADKDGARSGFAADLEPGLAQYVRAGKPKPRMGDFEIFQKPTDGQLIGWTLLIPDQADFLKEILKKENGDFENQKSLSGGQIQSGSCRLVNISGKDVVRVDIEMANGGKSTNLHFWSPKNPGVISTLMLGLRPNKSSQSEKDFESIIKSLVVNENIK